MDHINAKVPAKSRKSLNRCKKWERLEFTHPLERQNLHGNVLRTQNRNEVSFSRTDNQWLEPIAIDSAEQLEQADLRASQIRAVIHIKDPGRLQEFRWCHSGAANAVEQAFALFAFDHRYCRSNIHRSSVRPLQPLPEFSKEQYPSLLKGTLDAPGFECGSYVALPKGGEIGRFQRLDDAACYWVRRPFHCCNLLQGVQPRKFFR